MTILLQCTIWMNKNVFSSCMNPLSDIKHSWGCWQPWQVWFGSLCREACPPGGLWRRTWPRSWGIRPCRSWGTSLWRGRGGCGRSRSTPPTDTPLLCSTAWGHSVVSVLCWPFSEVFWWSSSEAASEDTAHLHNNCSLWWKSLWRTREPRGGRGLTRVWRLWSHRSRRGQLVLVARERSWSSLHSPMSK